MENERLVKLRRKMYEAGVDVYFINTSDCHISEYVADYFRTVHYFSYFSGSLGQLVVTFEKAYLFVDGRYHTQAEKETLDHDIEVMKLGKEGVLSADDFMIQNYKDLTIGLDGKCVSTAFVKKLVKAGLKIKSVNIYDDIYEGRTPLSKDMLYELDVKYTGLKRNAKLAIIKKCLGSKCHVVNNLESIAYILNLRGNDIPYTPVFYAYLLFYDKEVYLFIDKERLSDLIIEGLNKDGVIIKDYEEYYEFLKTIKKRFILLDENKVNYESYYLLKKNNQLHHMVSIIEEMKTIKNPVEVKNIKLAHIYDGVAMTRFMMWLKNSDKEGLNEYDVKVKVNRFRLEYKAFDLSFNTIVGYDANAAMMHYSPTQDNNTALHNHGILLIDSGGQYFEGTTDITRTFALGEVSAEVKMYFTLVLKSMFNLASVRFLKGMDGSQLDILARKDLWERGIDYRCGTGHGVGHVLAVHEMPPNVRPSHSESTNTPFKVGNVFSDEPGVYFEGKFGIRCENLLLCKKAFKNEYGQFLEFEHLTMVPFDLDLVDPQYLDEKTITLLNEYHAAVYQNLSPYLNEEEKAFLAHATRRIA